MIYVYCRRPSDSARELVSALGATRLRRFDGQDFWQRSRRVLLEEGDVVVCWGDDFPAEIPGIHILNGADIGNKYEAACKIMNAGVPTIHVSRERPYSWTPQRTGGWLGRSFFHAGGNDLLNPGTPDYWVHKETILHEYRIHSFGGASIRAGEKRLREGFSLTPGPNEQLASSWVRSFDGGWRVCYDGFQSNAKMRRVAHRAVKALGLHFGAVDVGALADGSYIVLEVNRAPGLEGNSITAYANRIKKWIETQTQTQTQTQTLEGSASVEEELDDVRGDESAGPQEPAAPPRQTLEPGLADRIATNTATRAEWNALREFALRHLEPGGLLEDVQSTFARHYHADGRPDTTAR